MRKALDRRSLLKAAGAGAGWLAFESMLPAWAQTGSPGIAPAMTTLAGPDIALSIGQSPFTVGGRTGHAVTINGTLPAPPGLDWVCVSPKAGASWVLRSGQELKLVIPQAGLVPEALEGLDFEHFFLQPMDGPDREAHTRLAIETCLRRPRWRLSLQQHKLLGLP